MPIDNRIYDEVTEFLHANAEILDNGPPVIIFKSIYKTKAGGQNEGRQKEYILPTKNPKDVYDVLEELSKRGLIQGNKSGEIEEVKSKVMDLEKVLDSSPYYKTS